MGFTMVDDVVFTSDLSMVEKVVYMTICSFCFGHKDTCFPSLEGIAKKSGVCRRSVINATQGLAEKGLIEILHRANKTNLYKVLDKPKPEQKNSPSTSAKEEEQDFLNSDVVTTSHNETTNQIEDIKESSDCQENLESLVNTLGLGESDSTVVLNLASFANLEVSHIILCGKGYSISDIKETLINLTPEQLERGLNKLHRYNVKNASAYLMAILVNKDTTSKATRTNTTTKATTKKTNKKNKFNNFESRKYDESFYESLERVNCI